MNLGKSIVMFNTTAPFLKFYNTEFGLPTLHHTFFHLMPSEAVVPPEVELYAHVCPELKLYAPGAEETVPISLVQVLS